jgi:hypothetical protein
MNVQRDIIQRLKTAKKLVDMPNANEGIILCCAVRHLHTCPFWSPPLSSLSFSCRLSLRKKMLMSPFLPFASWGGKRATI